MKTIGDNLTAITIHAPSGNSYTFHKGQWLKITEKEDIEFFKKNKRIEVKEKKGEDKDVKHKRDTARDKRDKKAHSKNE